ncbi:predicted protein [Pyrenophora tritici-repentis Pt-1C-BFP]|uniref:Secreted protein n=1 Tax=Pyrenophora tritici-repentis (strain Pt-1C-BFP) TaxID=426418 RepID=B2WD76_PYRTR|nr:uncharacterized protein PTRG_07935 [Pyrenophora tritici-repentis Pt-1C-BFP]EDU50854.1 predicted protein [Pyrenophora tritici-repentis Pt-1C-BFP]
MNPISLLVLAMTVTAQFCPLRGGSGGSGGIVHLDVRRKALFIKEIGASQGFQPKMSWIGANGTRLVRQARSPEISLSYH